jgi:hypothetical protein
VTAGVYEFSGESVGGGLATSYAAYWTVTVNILLGAVRSANPLNAFVLRNVHDWDGGSHRYDPGFVASTRAWDVAQYAGSAALGQGLTPRASVVTDEGEALTYNGNGAVIGNKMSRVTDAVEKTRFDKFTPNTNSRLGGWFENVWWIAKKVYSRRCIYDIGPVPGFKPYGPYYRMERVVARFLCQ